MVVDGSTQAGGCGRVNECETTEIIGGCTSNCGLGILHSVNSLIDRLRNRASNRWSQRLFAPAIGLLLRLEFLEYCVQAVNAAIEVAFVLYAAAASNRGVQVLLNLGVQFFLREALRIGLRIG